MDKTIASSLNEYDFIGLADPKEGLATHFAAKLSHENSVRSTQWSQLARLLFGLVLSTSVALFVLPAGINSLEAAPVLSWIAIATSAMALLGSAASIYFLLIVTWPDYKILLHDLNTLKENFEKYTPSEPIDTSESRNAFQERRRLYLRTISTLNLAHTADQLQKGNSQRNRFIRIAYIIILASLLASGIAYGSSRFFPETPLETRTMAENQNSPNNSSSSNQGQSSAQQPTSSDSSPFGNDNVPHPAMNMEKTAASRKSSNEGALNSEQSND